MSHNLGSPSGSLIGFPKEKEPFSASRKFGFSPRPSPRTSPERAVRGDREGRQQITLGPTIHLANSHIEQTPYEDMNLAREACLMAGGLVGQAVHAGTTAVLSPMVGP